MKKPTPIHIPVPDLVDDPSARLHKPYDDPFDCPARILAPQIEPTNQEEQVTGENAHLQHCFVCRETVIACSIPTKRVLAFLDKDLNITATIVHLD
jgi:hypothetical protein